MRSGGSFREPYPAGASRYRAEFGVLFAFSPPAVRMMEMPANPVVPGATPAAPSAALSTRRYPAFAGAR